MGSHATTRASNARAGLSTPSPRRTTEPGNGRQLTPASLTPRHAPPTKATHKQRRQPAWARRERSQRGRRRVPVRTCSDLAAPKRAPAPVLLGRTGGTDAHAQSCCSGQPACQVSATHLCQVKVKFARSARARWRSAGDRPRFETACVTPAMTRVGITDAGGGGDWDYD
jgi:hypothetical protein